MVELTVEKLLNNEIPDKYDDKIFWYAKKITRQSSKIDIYIENKNLVTFDQYARELKVKKISDLARPSNDNSTLRNVLVSSGSFLWINNKLIVTQRTADTKYDPLAWTSPAGRCDRTPLHTALKETIEEIHIRSCKTNKLWMPDLAKGIIPESDDIQLYQTTIGFPEGISQRTTLVRTWLESKLIEEAELWFFYNKENNTMEFRVPLVTTLDEYLSYTNPEFDTDTRAVTLPTLRQYKVVPALKHLLCEVKEKHNG